MSKKKSINCKSVHQLRVMQYAHCGKIRAYLDCMGFYASEHPVDEDDIANGIVFETVPIKNEDWMRISRYAYELLCER